MRLRDADDESRGKSAAAPDRGAARMFLRRSLVVADATAFLIAAFGVGAIDRGTQTLSQPTLIIGGLAAWIGLACLYGNYRRTSSAGPQHRR